MFCGQLQCTAGEEKPYFVDYGTQYQQILLNDKICRLVASLCVTAPDGFLLFCLVGIWFCFFKIKDVLFVLKTEEIRKREMKFFPEKSFYEKKRKIVCIKKWQIVWKRKEKLLQKEKFFKNERRNCSKKEKRNYLKKERRHCSKKKKVEITGTKKSEIICVALLKKWRFALRISSINVTKIY